MNKDYPKKTKIKSLQATRNGWECDWLTPHWTHYWFGKLDYIDVCETLMVEISVNKDISVFEFYGYIGNIDIQNSWKYLENSKKW